jgi:hypothetical protein
MGTVGERVPEPRESGWLKPGEAGVFLEGVFGRAVPARTVQSWCRRPRDPLPHARLGGKVLIHREELMAWIRRGGTSAAA